MNNPRARFLSGVGGALFISAVVQLVNDHPVHVPIRLVLAGLFLFAAGIIEMKYKPEKEPLMAWERERIKQLTGLTHTEIMELEDQKAADERKL